jgi:hypothetical protein
MDKDVADVSFYGFPAVPLEALPWVSTSMKIVFFPRRARPAATMPETLIFPTPPFWT